MHRKATVLFFLVLVFGPIASRNIGKGCHGGVHHGDVMGMCSA
jgi:hypothetical protein